MRFVTVFVNVRTSATKPTHAAVLPEFSEGIYVRGRCLTTPAAHWEEPYISMTSHESIEVARKILQVWGARLVEGRRRMRNLHRVVAVQF
jgi:hypothetical protein